MIELVLVLNDISYPRFTDRDSNVIDTIGEIFNDIPWNKMIVVFNLADKVQPQGVFYQHNMNLDDIKKSIDKQSSYLRDRIQARKNDYLNMQQGYGTNCNFNYSLMGNYDTDENGQLTIIPIPNYIYSLPENLTPDIENQISSYDTTES